MASGRFISNSLGDSEKFSSLTDARHQVAYVLIVSWADAEGRFIADPVTMNGKLFTRLGWTPDLVKTALKELQKVGLIRLYTVDGKPYGVVEKFHEHNRIERKDDGTPKREAASKLPAPPAEQPRTNSAPTPQQPRSNDGATPVEVEVEVQVEEKGREMSESRDSDLTPTLVEIWNHHCGRLTRARTLNDKNLQRLTHALERRHGRDKALELFRAGIPAVRDDPHWLGSRASPVKRQGAPYGIVNYLRHVEEKADAATELATPPPTPATPTRPWRESDIVDNPRTGEVAIITSLLPDNHAIMNNGETWALEGCIRCNN